MYLYLFVYIMKLKEEYRMFVAYLSEKCYFVVSKNLKFFVVLLFELYGNLGKYGVEIVSILYLLFCY